MAKNKPVSTRLPEKAVEDLEKLAAEEHLDRASLIRKMLLEDIKEYQLKKTAENYRIGKIGVEQAARQAGVSVWEMVDYLKEQNIRPPAQTGEELETEWEESLSRG